MGAEPDPPHVSVPHRHMHILACQWVLMDFVVLHYLKIKHPWPEAIAPTYSGRAPEFPILPDLWLGK